MDSVKDCELGRRLPVSEENYPLSDTWKPVCPCDSPDLETEEINLLQSATGYVVIFLCSNEQLIQ